MDEARVSNAPRCSFTAQLLPASTRLPCSEEHCDGANRNLGSPPLARFHVLGCSHHRRGGTEGCRPSPGGVGVAQLERGTSSTRPRQRTQLTVPSACSKRIGFLQEHPWIRSMAGSRRGRFKMLAGVRSWTGRSVMPCLPEQP